MLSRRLGNDAQRFRTWVLNPKMLPAFVKREPVRLAEEDVRLAVYCLARHGQRIWVPDRPDAKPRVEYLAWHNENRFVG